ncbi:MAG: flagellar type III secretion system pore protein FliP [Chitinivibrionales bacterium]
MSKKLKGFNKRLFGIHVKASLLLLVFTLPVLSQALPKVTMSLAETDNPGDVSVALQIVFLITILALAPSILVMMTSFVRIVIVFAFLRRAVGTQTMPPNQVLIGLALFLTFFIMTPVMTEINDNALQPYLGEKITWKEGIDRAKKPVKNFMLNQVDEKDIALFVRVGKKDIPETVDDLTLDVIIPAFMISELKKAFLIGFLIYIPFLIIDMVVASILLSMGMMMLPPIMISLPFKIVLFVLIDGWHLLAKELVLSFN